MSTKRSVLALHGHYQNANIFEKRLAALRKEAQDVELVFIDAPHILQPVDFVGDYMYQISVQSSETKEDPTLTRRGWWRNAGKIDSAELAKSLAVVRDVLKERKFDGVFGFSQGAALAAIVCALLEKPYLYPPFLVDGKPPHPPFQFCIAVSGFRLPDPICDLIFTSSYSTPTLHILGKNDVIVIEERTTELVQVSNTMRIEEHDGGHYVPCRGKWLKFLAEFLGNPLSDIPSPSARAISTPSSGTATPTAMFSAAESIPFTLTARL